MPLSNTVVRRYTPPTCTLEIAAKPSPLSRWTQQPVLKQVRFQLQFDDPKLSSEQHWLIRGDRAQLEALCSVVETYIQTLLHLPADRLRPQTLDWQDIGAIAPLPSSRVHHLPQAAAPTDSPVAPEQTDEAQPLAATAPDSEVDAAGLGPSSEGPDDYLPEDYLPETLSDAAGNAAAEAAAHSNGIYLQPQGLVTHHLHLGQLATAESGTVVPLSTLQLFDLANALDNYAVDTLALPPLERPKWLSSPTSWARVAAVAVITLGLTTSVVQWIDRSGSMLQSNAPTSSQGASSADQQHGAISLAPPSAANEAAPLDSNLNQPFDLNFDPLPPPPPLGETSPPALSSLPTVPIPQTAPAAPSTGQFQVPEPPTDRLAAIPAPAAPSAPAPAAPPRVSSSDDAISRRLAAPSAAADSALSGAPYGDAAIGLSREDARPSNGGTAFDTIPQVAQVRTYFQQRWQVPDGLTRALEYRLLLNRDGSIQRIVPLGQAAGDYIDRTEMPLVGEPFVSPLQNGQTAQLRLVLNPDGRVQTFLEYVD